MIFWLNRNIAIMFSVCVFVLTFLINKTMAIVLKEYAWKNCCIACRPQPAVPLYVHKMIFIASLVLLLIIKLRFPKGKSIHRENYSHCIERICLQKVCCIACRPQPAVPLPLLRQGLHVLGLQEAAHQGLPHGLPGTALQVVPCPPALTHSVGGEEKSYPSDQIII